MARCFAVCALLLVPALWGETFAGHVVNISPGSLILDTGHSKVAIVVLFGPVQLQIGRSVRVNCEKIGSQWVAGQVDLEQEIRGTVQRRTASGIEVLNASGSKKPVPVRLNQSTRFSVRRPDLSPGVEVNVVGWAMPDGTLEATRVTLYNTDMPVLPDAERRR